MGSCRIHAHLKSLGRALQLLTRDEASRKSCFSGGQAVETPKSIFIASFFRLGIAHENGNGRSTLWPQSILRKQWRHKHVDGAFQRRSRKGQGPAGVAAASE